MSLEWWRTFFDEQYTEVWAKAGMFDDTAAAITGILGLLPRGRALRILDVPCGFGRHAGPLQQHGHDVTGVDLSEDQLAIARARNPGPIYVAGDMRTPPQGPFDVVLNLFSSIGYFEDPADDAKAIRAWHEVMAPDGSLLIETNHRDRIASIYKPDEQIPLGEDGTVEFGTMDWATGVMHRTVRFPDGAERSFQVRLYTVTELLQLVADVGFVAVEAFGDWAGDRVGLDGRLIIRARRAGAS